MDYYIILVKCLSKRLKSVRMKNSTIGIDCGKLPLKKLRNTKGEMVKLDVSK